MGMEIHINGVRIKQPKNPAISHYNITKAGRVASGKMTMELVAKKKKLFFEYEVISGADMDQILAQVDGSSLFFDVSYIENGKSHSFTAYVGEINRGLLRGGGLHGWYWKDASFNLIEQ